MNYNSPFEKIRRNNELSDGSYVDADIGYLCELIDEYNELLIIANVKLEQIENILDR